MADAANDHLKLLMLSLCIRAAHFSHRLNQFRKRQCLFLELCASALDFRHIQYFVDQSQQLF